MVRCRVKKWFSIYLLRSLQNRLYFALAILGSYFWMVSESDPGNQESNKKQGQGRSCWYITAHCSWELVCLIHDPGDLLKLQLRHHSQTLCGEESYLRQDLCLVEYFHPALRRQNGTCHWQLRGHEMFLQERGFNILEMTRFGLVFFTRKGQYISQLFSSTLITR